MAVGAVVEIDAGRATSQARSIASVRFTPSAVSKIIPHTASECLALASFRDAKAAGITSADHIELNQAGKPQPDGTQIAAGTSLFVVQGKGPSDPLAPRSTTDVKQAIDQPVEHHLQKIEQLQQQQTQVQGQVTDSPTQADIAPKAPKL